LFSKFNKQLASVFIDPSSQPLTIEENVNVIVSPSLYWVKKLDLPVKNVREAKTLLPSLFEDILPEGSYSYSVYKDGEYFFIFAYEDKKILEVCASKGIHAAQIEGVYFAQSELAHLTSTHKINDTQSIYVKDDIVLLVPCMWLEDDSMLDVNDLSLSKHNVKLKQFGHIVDDKSFNTLVVIFSVLILLLGVEYFITQSKLQSTLELRDEIFEKNGLKSTMMQNRSMLKSYTTLHDKQTKIREYIGYFLSLKLRNGEKISSIRYKSNKFNVDISGIKNGAEKIIVESLKNKKMIFKPTFKNDTLSMEISL